MPIYCTPSTAARIGQDFSVPDKRHANRNANLNKNDFYTIIFLKGTRKEEVDWGANISHEQATSKLQVWMLDVELPGSKSSSPSYFWRQKTASDNRGMNGFRKRLAATSCNANLSDTVMHSRML